MPLSNLTARRAKPREKPYKLSDGGGLHLVVQPNGSKLWRLKYRFAGKEKLLSFGAYPLIAIAEARAKRDDAKRQILNGLDPATERRTAKLTAKLEARTTFGLIAEEFIEQMETAGAAEATLIKKRWILQDLAAPLANRPIKEITPIEVLDLLKRVEKSGRLETARRLRGNIGAVFRLAIVTLRAEKDPTYVLRGALASPQVTSRAAIVDEGALGRLLCSLDEFDGWPAIGSALKLLILTCVRPGEVRGAVRSEFDLAEAVWRIPAERMKMRQPHSVPLSRQSVACLTEIYPISENGHYVFPSIRSNRKPLSENTLNAALRRMGYTKEEVTAHGFRSTASSILNERGYDPDVIEAVLAHRERNAVRRAYNRATYFEQRVTLMQEWADLLDGFRKL